jgi:hypothetical protein
MSKSLAVPIEIGSKGSVRIVQDDDHVKQLVRTALGVNTSENPFQQGIGLGDRFIFDIDTVGDRAKLEARINVVFANLQRQRIARLAPGKELTIEKTKEGELEMTISYVNLETDRVDEVMITQTAGGF